MYYRLTSALKTRFIDELRKYWQYHPLYQDLVDNIQGKFRFKERPSYGIVVKNSGGNRVDLSADNYIGVVNSYVFQTKVKDYPGIAVEWVREDGVAIQDNGGTFPSKPGIYFIELAEDEVFYVDPLYDVYREIPTLRSPTQAVLAQSFVEGTLRVFEMPAAYQLYEDANYRVVKGSDGRPTGELEMLTPLDKGRWLQVDYRYAGETTGPHTLYPNRANNQIIPGCVVAFGRRNKKGDRVAIVVQDVRSPTALEYGGLWELTLDFDVISRDVEAQQEIQDQTVLYLWGVLRPYLSSDGLEMTDISLGGESEEIFDETGDDYFYNSSFSVTVSTGWSIHVPLGLFIRQVSALTVAQSKLAAVMSDEEVAQQKNNIQNLEALGLETLRDPFFAGHNSTFETIK